MCYHGLEGELGGDRTCAQRPGYLLSGSTEAIGEAAGCRRTVRKTGEAEKIDGHEA
jgi:hypothetical protein